MVIWVRDFFRLGTFLSLARHRGELLLDLGTISCNDVVPHASDTSSLSGPTAANAP